LQKCIQEFNFGGEERGLKSQLVFGFLRKFTC